MKTQDIEKAVDDLESIVQEALPALAYLAHGREGQTDIFNKSISTELERIALIQTKLASINETMRVLTIPNIASIIAKAQYEHDQRIFSSFEKYERTKNI